MSPLGKMPMYNNRVPGSLARNVLITSIVPIGRYIVGSDVNHSHFGAEAVNFSVVYAPENMFGPIAANPVIDGSKRRILRIPDVQASAAPVFDARRANEYDVDVLA